MNSAAAVGSVAMAMKKWVTFWWERSTRKGRVVWRCPRRRGICFWAKTLIRQGRSTVWLPKKIQRILGRTCAWG